MKKKTIANLIMVAVILAIVAAGVLGVGHIRGWFDKADAEAALLTDFRGIVNLEREGVSYPVEQETVLRAGDRITCEPGATAVIQAGESALTHDGQAAVETPEPAVSSFAATVTAGEVFVNAKDTVTLSFDGKEIGFAEAVAALSVRSGAQSISVFAGTVGDAGAGQMLDWVGETLRVADLSIESLNEFCIGQIRLTNESRTLCFSNEDLDKLEEARRIALQEEADRKLALEQEKTTAEEPAGEPESEEQPEPETTEEPGQSEPAEPNETASAEPTEETPAEEKPDASAPEETPPSEPEEAEPAPEPEPEPALTVSLSIYCDTILNNWDNLDPAKAGYVPASGVILTSTVEMTAGETVFDVLKRACSAFGIQLEYSWTPMYNSYYIEGINNLYEFDCGPESGWMYKVDGWFPNYGCSSYTLSGGENIVWCYTCNGLGADVGGPTW